MCWQISGLLKTFIPLTAYSCQIQGQEGKNLYKSVLKITETTSWTKSQTHLRPYKHSRGEADLDVSKYKKSKPNKA